MRRWRLVLLVIGVGGTCGGLGFVGGRVAQYLLTPETLVVRLSPDETTRVSLVNLDRLHPHDGLAIHLDRFSQSNPALVARLPDGWEGPAGTERFIWSQDGSKVLLVGRHFFVRDDLFLDNGDQLYFLHDLKTGQSWVNSADDDRLPPLTAARIAGVEFTEPVILKPRAKVAADSPAKGE